MLLSVSILSVLKDDYKEIIPKLDDSSMDYFHIDVMDGNFVSNTSFPYDDILEVLKYSCRPLDVHLMVNEPIDYINDLKLLKPAYITIHKEIKNYKEIINYINKLHIKCGLSIKPNTDIEEIIDDLDNINMVLIMSVEPGFGGQKFIDNSIEKIAKLKSVIKEKNLDIKISVDGGINLDTGLKCLEAGADILVSGSYIINNLDNNIIEEFKKL